MDVSIYKDEDQLKEIERKRKLEARKESRASKKAKTDSDDPSASGSEKRVKKSPAKKTKRSPAKKTSKKSSPSKTKKAAPATPAAQQVKSTSKRRGQPLEAEEAEDKKEAAVEKTEKTAPPVKSSKAQTKVSGSSPAKGKKKTDDFEFDDDNDEEEEVMPTPKKRASIPKFNDGLADAVPTEEKKARRGAGPTKVEDVKAAVTKKVEEKAKEPDQVEKNGKSTTPEVGSKKGQKKVAEKQAAAIEVTKAAADVPNDVEAKKKVDAKPVEDAKKVKEESSKVADKPQPDASEASAETSKQSQRRGRAPPRK